MDSKAAFITRASDRVERDVFRRGGTLKRLSAFASVGRQPDAAASGRTETAHQAACNSSRRILRNAAAVNGFSPATFPIVPAAASRRAALIIV